MNQELLPLFLIVISVGILSPILSRFLDEHSQSKRKKLEEEKLSTDSTSEQIWQLDKSRNSLYDSVYYHSEVPIIDTSYSTVEKTAHQNKLQPQKKIVGNCEWCGTGYFEDDRNCVSCGGEIKRFEEVKNCIVETKKNKPQKYMVSVTDVFAYNMNDELIFTGKCLLDSNTNIKDDGCRELKYYFSSEPPVMNICNILWQDGNYSRTMVGKIILESQLATIDENTTTYGLVRQTFPKSRMEVKSAENVVAKALLVRYNSDEEQEFYGYVQCL